MIQGVVLAITAFRLFYFEIRIELGLERDRLCYGLNFFGVFGRQGEGVMARVGDVEVATLVSAYSIMLETRVKRL